MGSTWLHKPCRSSKCKKDSQLTFPRFLKLSPGGRGSTVVKVLCYKSEGRWFDPIWCQWIFH